MASEPGPSFSRDDAAATAALTAAIQAAAEAALDVELSPDCVVTRDDFGRPKSSDPTTFQRAWDTLASADAAEHWEPDWNWMELMSLRIGRSYRSKPASLAWAFDKLAIEDLCRRVGGEGAPVPRIAAWYEGGDADVAAVTAAVEQDRPLFVKPTHGSEAMAIEAFRSPREAGLEAVLAAVERALTAEPDVTEPWMLRSLRHGVLVQELYQSDPPCAMAVPPYACPLELKVQVLFGQIVCGSVRGFPWQLSVLPDGSLHRWSSARVTDGVGLPKEWRRSWGTAVPPELCEALERVLAKDWKHIGRLSRAVATEARLDEVRVDWLLGDPSLGPRIGEIQYIGAAGNVRPDLWLPLCRAFLQGHRLHAARTAVALSSTSATASAAAAAEEEPAGGRHSALEEGCPDAAGRAGGRAGSAPGWEAAEEPCFDIFGEDGIGAADGTDPTERSFHDDSSLEAPARGVETSAEVDATEVAESSAGVEDTAHNDIVKATSAGIDARTCAVSGGVDANLDSKGPDEVNSRDPPAHQSTPGVREGFNGNANDNADEEHEAARGGTGGSISCEAFEHEVLEAPGVTTAPRLDAVAEANSKASPTDGVNMGAEAQFEESTCAVEAQAAGACTAESCATEVSAAEACAEEACAAEAQAAQDQPAEAPVAEALAAEPCASEVCAAEDSIAEACAAAEAQAVEAQASASVADLQASKSSVADASAAEVSVSEACASEVCVAEYSVAEACAAAEAQAVEAQASASAADLQASKTSVADASAAKASTAEACASNARAAEASGAEVCSAESSEALLKAHKADHHGRATPQSGHEADADFSAEASTLATAGDGLDAGDEAGEAVDADLGSMHEEVVHIDDEAAVRVAAPTGCPTTAQTVLGNAAAMIVQSTTSTECKSASDDVARSSKAVIEDGTVSENLPEMTNEGTLDSTVAGTEHGSTLDDMMEGSWNGTMDSFGEGADTEVRVPSAAELTQQPSESWPLPASQSTEAPATAPAAADPTPAPDTEAADGTRSASASDPSCDGGASSSRAQPASSLAELPAIRRVTAVDYFHYMQGVVRRQAPSELAVEALLRSEVAIALTTNWHGQPQPGGVPYWIRRFGSRAYGVALPSSDIDVVCELPANADAYCVSRRILLERVLARLKGDERCTALKSAIVYKKTVEFRYAELRVDFTVQVGSCAEFHTPTQVTQRVGFMLKELPSYVRNLAHLVVDWAKQAQACWNRHGSIDKKLKAVHWVMLTIAWWRWQGDDTLFVNSPAGHTFTELLRFYDGFPFEGYRIDAFAQPLPALPRAASAAPLWLSDPLDPERNLAERVDGPELARIRAAVRQGLEGASCGRLWAEAMQRWDYAAHRAYGRPGPRPGEPAPPPLPAKAPPQRPPATVAPAASQPAAAREDAASLSEESPGAPAGAERSPAAPSAACLADAVNEC